MRAIHMEIVGDTVKRSSAVAGVQGSGNVDVIVLSFDAAWDGYAKRCVWWDAHGQQAAIRLLGADLLVDIESDPRVYAVPVPPEALRYSGSCVLVVEGVVPGRRARTVTQSFQVVATPPGEDSEELTPDQIQQFQFQVDALLPRLRAVLEAETARETAERQRIGQFQDWEAATSLWEAAENNRELAERERTIAEEERIVQEVERKNSEADRVADEVRRQAEARAAVEATWAVAQHPPTISATGKWLVWNSDECAYRDSGALARGDRGEQGPKGEQGDIGPAGPQGIQGPPGPRGIDAVAVESEGNYVFRVDTNGHLILCYTGETPDFSINAQGHLILNL